MDTIARLRSPSVATASLGILGIAGGSGLLAAFVFEIPQDVNTWRLVLFCLGAIAVAVATRGRQAAESSRWAVAGTRR